MPRPVAMPVLRLCGLGEGRASQFAALAAAFTTSIMRGIAQVAQPEFHRIGLGARRQFVHEGFVREGILQARGGAQRAGQERRHDVVHKGAFGFHRARAFGRAADVPAT